MRSLALALFALSVSTMLTGCNDPEAPQKCRAIGTAYCEKLFEFCESDEQPAPSVESCKSTYDETVICDDALYLDGEEACLGDISEIEECTYALPDTCSGVVIVDEKAEVEP